MERNIDSYMNALDMLMASTDKKISNARIAFGIKPDILTAETLAQDAILSLDAFSRAVIRVSLLTGQEPPSYVIRYVNDRTKTLRELGGEVLMCKTIISRGNARQRNVSLEN